MTYENMDLTGPGSLLTDRSAVQSAPYTIYFAGGLFDHKELIGNAILARYIDKVSQGRYACALPQNLEQASNRAADVRNQDLLQVMKNDLSIFNFDGTELDSGTVVEMMFAKMLDIPAVILRTDFRNAGDGAKDGDPWNLMCSAYPRTKVLLIHGMVWYQEAMQQGGTAQEIEERLYTRIAKVVIEYLDAVVAAQGYLTNDVNVQEIYKAALRFPGAGLERTSDSFLRSIIRRKTAKGLLPKESDSNNLIPRKAQRLHALHLQVQRLAKEMQSGSQPASGVELVLSSPTVAKCDDLMEAVLDLDRFFGENLAMASELEKTSAEAAASMVAAASKAISDRAQVLGSHAEAFYREATYNSRSVCQLPHVSVQEAALHGFTMELQDLANKIVQLASEKVGMSTVC